jgi:hypothetical protein
LNNPNNNTAKIITPEQQAINRYFDRGLRAHQQIESLMGAISAKIAKLPKGPPSGWSPKASDSVTPIPAMTGEPISLQMRGEVLEASHPRAGTVSAVVTNSQLKADLRVAIAVTNRSPSRIAIAIGGADRLAAEQARQTICAD